MGGWREDPHEVCEDEHGDSADQGAEFEPEAVPFDANEDEHEADGRDEFYHPKDTC